MGLPNRVNIVEVGPRDGLQNEALSIPLDDKLRFIELLSESGLTYIEVGSFVSPKWVPQMADSAAIFANLPTNDITYAALTPNMRGFDAALGAGVKEVAVFGAASEMFSQRNINCSIAESLDRFVPLIKAAQEHNIRVRGYVSCVLGCPYEGDISPQKVAEVSQRLMEMGCYEVSLGDTIGVGTPMKTQALIEAVASSIAKEHIAVHFHNTYGQALANILVALQHGISTIDCAAGGLGGCPYAKGASGNVATEDVIYMCEGMGVSTGIDLNKIMRASEFILDKLNKPANSNVYLAKHATAKK